MCWHMCGNELWEFDDKSNMFCGLFTISHWPINAPLLRHLVKSDFWQKQLQQPQSVSDLRQVCSSGSRVAQEQNCRLRTRARAFLYREDSTVVIELSATEHWPRFCDELWACTAQGKPLLSVASHVFGRGRMFGWGGAWRWGGGGKGWVLLLHRTPAGCIHTLVRWKF